MELEDVCDLIKSIVISTKNDVLVENINREFKEEAGINIPYRKHNHETLESFLKSIDGVDLRKNRYGEVAVKVTTQNAKHIQELVKEQRSSDKRRRRRRNRGGGRSQPPRPSFRLRKSSVSGGGSWKSSQKPFNVQNNQSQSKLNDSLRKPLAVVRPTLKENQDVRASGRQPVKKTEEGPKPKVLHFRQLNLRTTQDGGTDIRGLPFRKVEEPEVEKFADENCNNEGNESDIFDEESEYSTSSYSSNEDIFELDEEDDLNNSSRNDIFEIDENISLKVTLNSGTGRKVEVASPVSEKPPSERYVLLGDDFFQKYADSYLQTSESKNLKFISPGHLCLHKFTLKAARKILSRQMIPPKKILVLMGATDIIAGRTVEEIAFDYYTLINDLKSAEDVKLCTIPPFMRTPEDKILLQDNLLELNILIKCIPEDLDRDIKIIDLYEEFLKKSASLGLNVSYFFSGDFNFNEKGLLLLDIILSKYLN